MSVILDYLHKYVSSRFYKFYDKLILLCIELLNELIALGWNVSLILDWDDAYCDRYEFFGYFLLRTIINCLWKI